MNEHQLLAELFRRGVKVWANGDQLHVRAPKGALTPELRDSLAVKKLEILSAVSSMNVATRVPHVPLVTVSRNGNLPLSFNQQRLWSLAQIHADSPVYNLSKALRFTGPLSVSALEQSIREIVRRHEILRTKFPVVEGQSVQIVCPQIPVQLPVVDLREFRATEREARVQRVASVESRRPFNLDQGPLLRVKLLKLREEEHLFLLIVHHLVFDGWSFNVFCRELATLYAAFSAGKPSPLRALPIQYADFAHWEQQMLQHEALKGQLDYWKQQLGGDVPALELPVDRPRSQGQISKGARQSLILTEKLTGALRTLSQREESTLFMTLLAAFQSLLHGYTGQEDIIVCSPIAGRYRGETKELIGHFNRLLPMRTDLSGNPGFRDVLGRVRRVVLEAYEHQDVPLQILANFSNLVRTPLFRGMFLLQIPGQLPAPPGLSTSLVEVHNGVSDFDLSLSMEETAVTITGVFEYKTDLFDDATISQMIRDFQTLLEEIVANPDRCISKTRRRAPPVPGLMKIGANRPFTAPRNELELELTGIWEKVLAVQPIGVHDNFFDLGGHSLLALRLCDRLAKATGHPVPLLRVFQAPTIAQLASVLRNQEEAPGWTALVPVRHGGTMPPLFIVPPAGETIRTFAHWTRYFDPEQPVYGLQPLGFDRHESPHDSVEAMAAYYLADIRKRQPTGPYVLAGICFGAVVALEMAQRLQDQGAHVALVAIFDLGFPNRPGWTFVKPPSLTDRVGRFRNYWREGNLIRACCRNLATRLKVLCNRLQPKRRRFQRVFEAHQKAYLDYRVRPYAGELVLIQSQQYAALEDIRAQWAALTTGTFRHVVIPDTTHSEMFQERHASQLIQQLTQLLQTVDTAGRRMNLP